MPISHEIPDFEAENILGRELLTKEILFKQPFRLAGNMRQKTNVDYAAYQLSILGKALQEHDEDPTIEDYNGKIKAGRSIVVHDFDLTEYHYPVFPIVYLERLEIDEFQQVLLALSAPDIGVLKPDIASALFKEERSQRFPEESDDDNDSIVFNGEFRDTDTDVQEDDLPTFEELFGQPYMPTNVSFDLTTTVSWEMNARPYKIIPEEQRKVQILTYGDEGISYVLPFFDDPRKGPVRLQRRKYEAAYHKVLGEYFKKGESSDMDPDLLPKLVQLSDEKTAPLALAVYHSSSQVEAKIGEIGGKTEFAEKQSKHFLLLLARMHQELARPSKATAISFQVERQAVQLPASVELTIEGQKPRQARLKIKAAVSELIHGRWIDTFSSLGGVYLFDFVQKWKEGAAEELVDQMLREDRDLRNKTEIMAPYEQWNLSDVPWMNAILTGIYLWDQHRGRSKIEDVKEQRQKEKLLDFKSKIIYQAVGSLWYGAKAGTVWLTPPIAAKVISQLIRNPNNLFDNVHPVLITIGILGLINSGPSIYRFGRGLIPPLYRSAKNNFPRVVNAALNGIEKIEESVRKVRE